MSRKIEKEEDGPRSTPTQKRQCLPRLSVRVCPSCVWVEGGVYFQVELTRTETLVDTAQQATTTTTTPTPGADAEFRAQNSEPKKWGRQGVEGCTSPQDSGVGTLDRRDGQRAATQ